MSTAQPDTCASIRTESLFLVYADDVGTEDRECVELSTWAAERSATNRHGKISSNPGEWVRAFREVLGKTGWITTAAETRSLEVAMQTGAGNALKAFLAERLGLDPAAGDCLTGFLDEVGWPDEPRCFGRIDVKDGQLTMHGTHVLSVGTTSPETASGASGSSISIEMQVWEGVLNRALFGAVKPALQERYRAQR